MHFIKMIINSMTHFQEVAQMFDVIDVIFDFSGVITGYAVSPDSR